MDKQLYAIACLAVLDLPSVTKTRIVIDTCVAINSEEAASKALALGRRTYPPSEGWSYDPVFKLIKA